MAAAANLRRRAARPERTAGGARLGPLADALVVVGLGGLLVAGTEIAFVLHRGGPYAWLTALFPVVGLLYIGVGLLA